MLDDADLDQAVDAAAFGAFMNQGQICMSTERFIVDEEVADAFVEKFAAKAKGLPAGDPRGHVVLGALVSETAAERMDDLIGRTPSPRAPRWWPAAARRVHRRGDADRRCRARDADL